MTKLLLSFLLAFSVTMSVLAQFGGNGLAMAATEYVEVTNNLNGVLNINNGFTYEAWIFNAGGASDQKIGGKIGGDFKNGFIFGIDNSKVSFEVFDNNGLNTNLKVGFVPTLGWSHVAGTYEVGGMMKVYINGVKVGEKAASSAPHNSNSNPFRIGIAPWDVNALGFQGIIDELRYWSIALDEDAIRAGMFTPIGSIQNLGNLKMYFDFNQDSGPLLFDLSLNFSNGQLVPMGSGTFVDNNMPYSSDGRLFENDVQGVWNVKKNGASDIMTVQGEFDPPTEDPAPFALFSHSDGGYTLTNNGPTGVDATLSKIWRTVVQGSFLLTLNFDLNPIDLTGYNHVVLLRSEDDDFSDADVINGEVDLGNHTFTVSDEAFLDGYYYTLGFQTASATKDLASGAFNLNISPNPSHGTFSLNFEKAMGELDASIFDLQGRRVWQDKLAENQSKINLELAEILTTGMYCLKLTDEEGNVVARKLVVD